MEYLKVRHYKLKLKHDAEDTYAYDNFDYGDIANYNTGKACRELLGFVNIGSDILKEEYKKLKEFAGKEVKMIFNQEGYDDYANSYLAVDMDDEDDILLSFVDHLALLYQLSYFDFLYNALKSVQISLTKEKLKSLGKSIHDIRKSRDVGPRTLFVGYSHGVTNEEIEDGTIYISNKKVKMEDVTDKQWLRILKNDLQYAYNVSVDNFELQTGVSFSLASFHTKIMYITQTFYTIQSHIDISSPYHRKVISNEPTDMGLLEKIHGLKFNKDTNTLDFMKMSDNSEQLETLLTKDIDEPIVHLLQLLADQEDIKFSLNRTEETFETGYIIKSINGDTSNPLLHTIWGRVLFEADYTMKMLTSAMVFQKFKLYSNRYFMKIADTKIPSLLSLYKQIWMEEPDTYSGDENNIMTFLELTDVSFTEMGDGSVVVFDSSLPRIERSLFVGQNTVKQDMYKAEALPSLEKEITNYVNEHIDEIMEEYPLLKNILHVVRLFGMAKYAKNKGWLPPKDESFETFKKSHHKQFKQDKEFPFGSRFVDDEDAVYCKLIGCIHIRPNMIKKKLE